MIRAFESLESLALFEWYSVVEYRGQLLAVRVQVETLGPCKTMRGVNC